MKPCAILLLGLAFLTAQEEVAFVKYYLSEDDFRAGNPLRATERYHQTHLEVAYNEERHPIWKRRISAGGEVQDQELYSYDGEARLEQRARLNAEQVITELIHYGEDEPWSVAFRDYLYPPEQHYSFGSQRSIFSLSAEGQIEAIEFRTVDGIPYGRIELRYDHLGFLTSEVWHSVNPPQRVRRFEYRYDIITGKHRLWEYGRGGREVTHMVLSLAPADRLYVTPPPRTGNSLVEAAQIIEELRTSRHTAPIAVFIPALESDRMILHSGETMPVEFLEIQDGMVRFRPVGEPEVLEMPLQRVRSITSRWGQMIYPP